MSKYNYSSPRHVCSTITGIHFDLDNPKFKIEDIAHALSMQCRFNGHIPHFYSVAQHSVLLALQLPAKLRFAGLMHDAAEAYLGDVPSPLKDMLPAFRLLERELEEKLFAHFHIQYPLPPEIKEADTRMLLTEGQQFGYAWQQWGILLHPYDINIVPWTQRLACRQFLIAYETLTDVDY